MTPEQAARLTDIVARVVRGESGASRELMGESRKWAVWSGTPIWTYLTTLDGGNVGLYTDNLGMVSAAWADSTRRRRDLVGLSLDEAKARVTAEFAARGYVVLP